MFKGSREKLMYVIGIHTDSKKTDVLCTVDVDPDSPTYCQIIHKLRMLAVGDELHHSGWNICSSCHGSSCKRDTLVLPCLMSDRIYFIDTSEEKVPKIKKKSAAEAHRMFVEVYGDTAPTDKSCRERFRRFKDENFSVEDKPRSGQSNQFEDKDLEAVLEEDQSQTQEELAESLEVTQQALSVRLRAIEMI
ncbi:selenium-binding protein 1-B-like isoform X1 [Pseudomyrmex gracilis]|uniref:selenium-binding protein 1-B-like isoform X1 n=1 Tax=Pseudomyrmex gracilis TaxID=219809 RepID=UPI00099491CA|nr:selenium-binding protein 1-B-like isoform X1 [Pseudomyrmex gracilis]